MASNKYNSLQGLRGYRMVELAQRSVDKSSRQSQPETKCSIRKPKLEKENRPITGNNNNTCLPITKSKSNTQTGTDSSQNILRLSHDSLSIMVDDPELVEIISSLKDNESGIHCEVDNENFNKKTVQIYNKTVTEKICDDPTAKLLECPISNTIHNKSDLANYFGNFTTNNSITGNSNEMYTPPSNNLCPVSQEIEIELSEVSNSLKTLQEIEFMEQNENKAVSSLVIEENETMETKTTQTQVQLSLLPDTNTTENDYVSDNSMSILIGSSELHNLIDNLDEDPSHIILDPKSIPVSIPANENELTSNNNATAEESLYNKKVKKSRKKIADPSEWNDIKNKRKRECGEAYQGWTKQKGMKAQRGVNRSERKLGPACTSNHCNKTKDCLKVSESQREFIFNFFWKKMSWDQKKVYVATLVSKQAPKRRTTGDPNSSRRKMSLAYTLRSEDDTIFKVCKKMFLSTLGLNEFMLINWMKHSKGGMTQSTTTRNRVRQNGVTTRDLATTDKKKHLEGYVNQLPKLPSHYCRKNTLKTYLEPTFKSCMSDIYKEYTKQCAALNPPQKPLSRFTFDLVIKENNIAFQPPKKDRCDLCISYETGNAKEEEYQKHQAKKEKARAEKLKDKNDAKEGISTVLTMDLQAVKVTPSLNASALYYKTKLCIHNFTIYNINTHHCRCYWFDETEADLTANTFATCLIDYLSDTISDSQETIIIWSDGCTYQNRNAAVSNALLSFSVNKGITIYQKYLTKGHTQMEADSVHATIERKIKNKCIYLPSDYTRLTSEARRNPEPYETKSLDFTFCKNYGVDMVYSSIRPGKSTGDPMVTDITVIKYSPDGIITVKTDFDGEFQDLPKKRGKRAAVKPLENFTQLHKQRIPIKKQKWLHLQQLKEVIPKDCHNFYDNLPYE